MSLDSSAYKYWRRGQSDGAILNPSASTGGNKYWIDGAPFQFLTSAVYTAPDQDLTATALTNSNTFGAPTSGPVSIMRPDGVVSNAGAWVDQAAGSTNIYTSIDEATGDPDDADYIRSEQVYAGQTKIVEFSLSDVSDPGVSTDHTVRYRFRKQGPLAMTYTVRLMQGTTEIASWQHTNVSASFVSAVQTLTGTQADAITDYTDLRLRFEASA